MYTYKEKKRFDLSSTSLHEKKNMLDVFPEARLQGFNKKLGARRLVEGIIIPEFSVIHYLDCTRMGKKEFRYNRKYNLDLKKDYNYYVQISIIENEFNRNWRADSSIQVFSNIRKENVLYLRELNKYCDGDIDRVKEVLYEAVDIAKNYNIVAWSRSSESRYLYTFTIKLD